jgi:DNA invertase Pin-like site-specific DNA recombinase
MSKQWSEESRLYYQTISAMGKLAMEKRRLQGERMHLAPLGYKNGRDEQGRSILVRDPKTHSLIQQALKLREQGKSIRKICRIMFDKGLCSRTGQVLSAGAMERVLKRRYD